MKSIPGTSGDRRQTTIERESPIKKYLDLAASVSGDVLTEGILFLTPVSGSRSFVDYVTRDLTCQAEIQNPTQGGQVDPWIAFVSPWPVSFREGQKFVAELLPLNRSSEFSPSSLLKDSP